MTQASMAGRKAKAQAIQKGASKKEARLAYCHAYEKVRCQSSKRKAYMKMLSQSPKIKTYRKIYNQSSKRKTLQRMYKQSSDYKTRQQTYWKSPTGKAVIRAYRQSSKGLATGNKLLLRWALQINGPLKNGYPDAGLIEQKIGTDRIQPEQWRRAAWAYSRGIIYKLLFAKTHEEAASNKKHKIISFEKYAKELGMSKEWNGLIKKVKILKGGN